MGTKMSDLVNMIVNSPKSQPWQEPRLFDLSNEADGQSMQQLLESGLVHEVVDEIGRSVDELFDIDYPSQKDSRNQQDYEAYLAKLGELIEYGRWVYLPWTYQLVHFPPAADLRRLLSSRNRNLVNESEQQRLGQATVLVVGLSVGSNIVESIVQQGLAGTVILADKDSLDPTNLNRIRGSFADVGQHKVDLMAKKISSLDPYLKQIHYRDGLTQAILDGVLSSHDSVVVVDEMDDLKLKLQLRQSCRARGVPVLMATDDGDDILIDIERYDLDSSLPILHGRVPQEMIDHVLSGAPISRREAGVIIGKHFVGSEYVPLRMIESLFEVGKSLPSWPQLGGATALAGVVVAYCVKRIVLGQPLRQGRYLIGPDSTLNLDYDNQDYNNQLTQARQALDKGLSQ